MAAASCTAPRLARCTRDFSFSPGSEEFLTLLTNCAVVKRGKPFSDGFLD